GYAVASVLELSGASVCVMGASSAAQGLDTYFQSRGMRYQVLTSEQWDEAVKGYAGGACTLLTGDITALAAARSRLAATSRSPSATETNRPAAASSVSGVMRSGRKVQTPWAGVVGSIPARTATSADPLDGLFGDEVTRRLPKHGLPCCSNFVHDPPGVADTR
ncbi:MAG TPA: hypothetical protein PKU91_06635, partial [Phycisphaerales bacterium]|nr:hypothetical protein [Phycisphaerales bacterium]